MKNLKWMVMVLAASVAAASVADAQSLVRSARFGGSGTAPMGGTFTYGLVGLPPTFNPFTVQSLTDTYIQYLWFPQLVQFNSASGQNECYVAPTISKRAWN